MDANELIKAAPEVAKGAGALAAAIPFTGIVKRMLGPAADEVAEMWKDHVRLYRYERQLKCVEKAEKMAKDAGFTPQAVPPKILFPLLEGASLEEDETLHDMWAALLANAASPENAQKVRPGFIAMLKAMAPDEAALLTEVTQVTTDYLHHPVNDPKTTVEQIDRHNALIMKEIRSRFPIVGGEEESMTEERLQTCIHLLEDRCLIVYGGDIVALSPLGKSFLQAVRPPTPKK